MVLSALRAFLFFAGIAVTSPAGAIVGGTADGGGAAQAAMVVNGRGGLCTGVFIAAQTLLTAAHCVAGTDVRIVTDGGLVAPLAVARHPRFNGQAIQTRQTSIDLALIRLPAAVQGDVVPLGGGAAPLPGTALSAHGYGLTDERNPASTGRYFRVSLAVTAPYGIGKLLVWAQRPGGQPGGACQGDSGGPLLRPDGTIVAIISWSTGHGGAQCGQYTQGILVAPQRTWIDTTLAQWGTRAQWQ